MLTVFILILVSAAVVRVSHNNHVCLTDLGLKNVLRSLVMARKHMLFCGNHEAAENTAIICSLFGSCKERGATPREWLNDVIGKLPYYRLPNQTEI